MARFNVIIVGMLYMGLIIANTGEDIDQNPALETSPPSETYLKKMDDGDIDNLKKHFEVEETNENCSNDHVEGQKNSDDCKLHVMSNSEIRFSYHVLNRKLNFVNLKLNFLNFEVNDTKYVINKQHWVWTYKGENGAYPYLFLSGDFGYLSFGLLWANTRISPLQVYLNKTGDCQPLTIGDNYTNYLIANALADMTSRIASKYDKYNESYWCFNQRIWLSSNFVYHACKNAICTFQTFEYYCCKSVVDIVLKTRTIVCGQDHYHFGELWWMVPIIIGLICFSFYPVLLSKIGVMINRLTKESVKRQEKLTSYAGHRTTGYDSLEAANSNIYISLNQTPITFISTICSPLRRCYFSVRFMSRLLRICIIILPMFLSAFHVCLDYVFAKEVIRESVNKGALVGFSTLIADPEIARREFLYIFGGPIVALSIYVAYGCILIVFPSDLERFLEKGLPGYSGEFIFLVRMPIKLKEKFSGMEITHLRGWKRFHKVLVAQIFLLLHTQFWKQSFKLFIIRWQQFIFPCLAKRLTIVIAIFVSIFICPMYIIFCMIELTLSVFYFMFPVFNCFWIVLIAFIAEYFKLFKHCRFFFKIIRNIVIIPLIVLLFISWYMFCIIFFDGFWFLSKITMFTYSGIIAYPKVSYGYLILAFMSLYYLAECFNAFGESYRQLLKMSIECCEKLKLRSSADSDFVETDFEIIMRRRKINKDLFMLIVERCRPRRNQIILTLLRFTSVFTILSISVQLLRIFDKLQDLSLVSHIFTTLFICALPTIIRMICMKGVQHRNRKKLKQKIYKVITDFARSKADSSTDDQSN